MPPRISAETAARGAENSGLQAEEDTRAPPLARPGGEDAHAAKSPPVAAPGEPAGKPLTLPGLVINLEQRCVDLEATICLDEGYLELIACTKDTKEHESIVVVTARPVHIHAALLVLGARNGNPAMLRALDQEQTRWVDIPPQGDLIEVFLEFKNPDGGMIERPISDFITRSDEQMNEPGVRPAEVAEPARFPNSFIFAGSQLGDPAKSPRDYLADQSGNVITIASFGDDLLCLPSIHSQENGALVWSVDPTHLPKFGSKVTLRLRLKNKPETGPSP